jgi:diguanylate cyclase (GGDEF)-like protein
LTQQGRKPESLKVLQRSVNLDPSEPNLQRLGELSAEVGDHKSAASAFARLADAIKAAGGDATQWIERAYTEDSSDTAIALAYGKSLLAQTQVGAAIFVLEPLTNAPSASLEFSETFAKALLAANRLTEAEVILWKLFEENPARMDDISDLIGQFIDANQDVEAVDLARKLEQSQRRKGERRAFLATMQEIVAKHRASPELLEFLSEQFNASNRETDYCQTLIKLFELHYGMGNFAKAAESLDRAAEVDAYEPGHQKRLESLRGKIDENRYKVIASRFSSLAVSTEPARNEEKSLGSATLQDLMLQVEILIQYGMRTKAIERLQRIQELFPREEERNENLQQLYLTAGLIPQYANAAPARPAASAPAATAPANDANDVSSFTRVAEITRKLYKQSNADAVLSTTVNEIGEQWKVSRCVAAMRKPGRTPTAIKEYCSGSAKLGNAGALEKVVAATQDLAVSRGTLTITDAQSSPELNSVRAELAELGVSSLLALPLADGPDHVGVLLLMNSTSRGWNSNDVVVLKTISEQIVIALNNAGLRRLVKSLSVTDEKSGLLKRASYLDLLMAETRRSVQNNTPVTVLLMRLGERVVMFKEFGEAAVEAAMQQIGLLFAANIRQNDLAFRYETTTVAIVLGETGEKEAMMAVDKLRKLLGDVQIADKPASIPFAAGVAEAVVRQQFDPVDIVTEVINRAEQALDSAVAQGPGKVVIQGASISSAAVA